MLESELLEAQNERDRSNRQAKSAKERLAEMEKDRKDLADEYVVLKTNYLALVREHEKEVGNKYRCSRDSENLLKCRIETAVWRNG